MNSFMSNGKTTQRRSTWLYSLVLIYLLLVGAYLRLVGLDWDANQHLHPDERFLTMVESSLEPVDGLGEYFDTAESTLNPHNRGHGFFVYGTLPIFLVRYVAEWLGSTGYGEVYLVGRVLSALADVGVIGLIFLAAARLYDRKVGVLAAAFYALAVLPIQQAHFFTVDTFTNFFIFLAVYFGVEVLAAPLSSVSPQSGVSSPKRAMKQAVKHPVFWPSVLFGLALGMAVASKINAVAVSVVLPMAAGLYWLRLPDEERERQLPQIAFFVILAAVVSVVTFRIFQPYAFSGPGFFGIKPNQAWVENLKALRAQTSGDVDFPPALQWARRPVWFSLQNLVVWGLGLPLGILAWAGFLWMGWRMLQGEWRRHGLLWAWTAIYFGWQSLQWNSTMRYQLPIYATLAIFAAWAVMALYRRGRDVRFGHWIKAAAVLVGILVLAATAVWAVAFSRIYPQPHTRVAATRWMFENIPGPINARIRGEDGEIKTDLVPFPQGTSIRSGTPYQTSFTVKHDGLLTEIYLPHVAKQQGKDDLLVRLSTTSQTDAPLGITTLSSREVLQEIQRTGAYLVSFDAPIFLDAGQSYQLVFETLAGLEQVDLCGAPIQLTLEQNGVTSEQQIQPAENCVARSGESYALTFEAQDGGMLSELALTGLQPGPGSDQAETLTVSLSKEGQEDAAATASVSADFAIQSDWRGEAYTLALDRPLQVSSGERIHLTFTLQGEGELVFTGATIANESSWDDGLPLRMDGYDPFGGIYQGGLNFEMYWEDNAEKLQRFNNTLAQSDYVMITSSRQWASTTRVPERYPLTTTYYRHLLGCPQTRSIEWCYNVAQPGTFEGDLGFELIKVFQSNPTFGPLEINDQFAEEAFTVYDHPKVFVFKKTEAYDPARVEEILGSVDLSRAVHVTPRKADAKSRDLMLPPQRLAEQRRGGTWADLFHVDAPQNRYQILGVLLWYLSVSLVGWITYPLLRFIFPGLADRGYPLARIAGLLLLAWLVWLAGSARIPFNRVSIGVVLLVMVLIGIVLALIQRDELLPALKQRWKYYLLVEGLFLAFFVVGLLIRYGNPDLWHPWKGGEKPMDFSYFNAVLKSTSFPPYDPWFAGGYINYYYYGFVIVGVLVKFLGIVPSFAYNLILPTLFATIAMGAFSIVWNLSNHLLTRGQGDSSEKDWLRPLVPAVGGALGMAVLGNLGVIRMLFRGFQQIAAPAVESGGLIRKLVWTIVGFFKSLTGSTLPYRLDEWYWNPSRVIGAEHGSPITEFPFFTFLYGDLHAHLIALPLTLLVLAWALSWALGRRQGHRRPLRIALNIAVGAIAVGALFPTNTWDFYPYLILGVVAVVYGAWRVSLSERDGWKLAKQIIAPLALAAVFVLLAIFFYQPYRYWYGQGYNQVDIWPGSHTPNIDYLTHWGLFLFLVVSWMFSETIDWMASTPLSALRKLARYKSLIFTLAIILGTLILTLGVDLALGAESAEPLPLGLGIPIAWWVLPLAAWAGVLLLRPDQSEAKRVVLFLVGTALMLTLTVEVIVLRGDIGRMNTVFKFYLQAWTLFAVSAAAAFGWVLDSIHRWDGRWRLVWQVVLVALVASAALYPVLASFAKIEDRIALDAPHTLDGITYMQYATYFDEGAELDLEQDYEAIRWMQENVIASPVIVEANQVEYHWGTRYTIYTGLPGVVGWNWHQRQQRTLTPHEWIYQRVDGVHQFYQTEDVDWAVDFLDRYDVRYIIVGQLERAKYAGAGLDKFPAYEGQYWQSVYQDADGETVIYQVDQDVFR